jgi:hypothetical protein
MSWNPSAAFDLPEYAQQTTLRKRGSIMFSIKHAVVTLAVGVGLLAAAGPASALSDSGGDPRAHNTKGEDSLGLWTVTHAPQESNYAVVRDSAGRE